MKNLVNNIWMVVVMVMSINFVACSPDDDAYGDMFSYAEKITPRDTTNTDPETNDIDWSREMSKSFGYNRTSGLWPSTILIHYTNGKDSIFTHNCPMTTTITGPAEIIVDSLAPSSRFISAIELSKDTTMWLPENAPIQERMITQRWEINMTNYKDTVTSTHVEARINIGGHIEPFLHGSEPAPTKKNDTPTSGEDVERNGKTYSVELAHICMDHKLHASYPATVELTTRVLREKTVKEDMPTPDLKVSSFGLVNNITFSPEFVGNNNVIWHKVCLTRNYINGKEYFSIWVDGVFVRTVELKSNERNDLYNSAYLVDGTWVPAILKYSSANDGGWDYTFVVSNEAKMKTVDQRMALTSGLSNFKKDNNAAQTPSVYTTTSVKEYNGKKLVTVNGYDKDNRPVITFTIGECL